MSTPLVRLNITFPEPLAIELRQLVPKRKRSSLIARMVKEHLSQIKQKKALKALRGAWQRGGGPDFSTEEELQAWRRQIWSSSEKQLNKRVRILRKINKG